MAVRGEQTLKIEKSDVNYGEIVDALNQSMLKVYDKNPLDFYEQFVLGNKKEETDTFATLVGSVTEFLLLECECDELEFENKGGEYFAFFRGKKGGGQSFLLADYLIEETKRNESDGFIERFQRAFDKCIAEDKYKKKTIEWALDDFQKKPKAGGDSAEDYFNFSIENIGKRVIDDMVIAKSKEVARMLKEDEFTRNFFLGENRMVKFPIEWEYNGMKCKSELDQWRVDDVNKIAYIDDLKCTYDNEAFEYSYLKNGYYLQNVFYIYALRWWLDNNDMKDYIISPGMNFIVADTSKNKRRPLVYKTSKDDVNKSFFGFSVRGVKYKGMQQLMDEVEWALKEGIFNINKENYLSKGNVNLTINYE